MPRRRRAAIIRDAGATDRHQSELGDGFHARCACRRDEDPTVNHSRYL
jgi:hypothetical protein